MKNCACVVEINDADCGIGYLKVYGNDDRYDIVDGVEDATVFSNEWKAFRARRGIPNSIIREVGLSFIVE